jgi:uncharacterized membrane protein YkoI
MQAKKLFAGFGVGALMLAGVIAANPFDGAAQQATPPAQTSEDDDQANGTPVVGNPTLQPAIDLIRAQESALEGQTGAVVVSVDLDGEDGVLAYDVVLDNGSEVQVDATSGTVIKTEQDGGDEGNGDNGNEDGGDQGNEDNNGGSQDNGENGENEDA